MGMIRMVMKSTSNMSINFGGEYEIDIKALATTLDNIFYILDKIVLDKNPDAFIKFKVKDTRKGSFEIDLQALIQFGVTVFTPQNIEFASNCLSSLVRFFEIKNHLKGNQPKEGKQNPENPNTTIIINNYGQYQYVNTADFHQYTTLPNIDEKITEIFKNCDRDSFNIKQDNKILFSAESEDFKHLSQKIDTDLLIQDSQIIDEITTLLIPTKVPYEGNSKWEFKYTKKIKATINDSDFIRKFQNGEVLIPPKTVLKAKMLCIRTLNENGDTLKEEYEITQVLEVIPPKKTTETSKEIQLKLFE